MAVVTSDFLAALFTQFQLVYEQYFEAAQREAHYREWTTEISSTTDTESYNWLGAVPQMKEWLDERQVGGLYPFNYSLKNRDWEDTIEVNRNTIEDDRLGIIRPRVQELAIEAAMHPDRLAIQALIDGTTDLAFDSVAFFANTRVLGESANIDNILTGTGTTVAQLQTDLAAARSAMRLFQDEFGRPRNLVGDTIICHPDIEQLFYQALNAHLLVTTAPSNIAPVVVPPDGDVRDNFRPNAGYKVISTPHLSDPNDWYFLSTRRAVRPLIFQLRKSPDFQTIDQPTAEIVFMRKKFLFGVDARYAVGYMDPRMAIKTTNT